MHLATASKLTSFTHSRPIYTHPTGRRIAAQGATSKQAMRGVRALLQVGCEAHALASHPSLSPHLASCTRSHHRNRPKITRRGHGLRAEFRTEPYPCLANAPAPCVRSQHHHPLPYDASTTSRSPSSLVELLPPPVPAEITTRTAPTLMPTPRTCPRTTSA